MAGTVTILQIAKESGVSIATVSRVINHSSYVSQATQERVNAVIEKYKFTPNAFARNLIHQQSMSIGILMPDISNPYFAAMFNEFENAALQAGYSAFLCNTAFRYADIQNKTNRELEYFQMMLEKKVDGVLIVGGQVDLLEVSAQYKDALRRLADVVPVVVVGGKIEGVKCMFVQRETGRGIFAAVNYLSSLGHRNIAFVGGEDGVSITESRLQAYQDALSALSLPQKKELIALSDYYTPDGYRAVQTLLKKHIAFSALLAKNDNIALGAYRALADAGLSVPKDVSVISCDQFFSADYYVPRLTSVDQHNERFGRFVINVLLGAMKGIQESVTLNFAPELIVRESCAAVTHSKNS